MGIIKNKHYILAIIITTILLASTLFISYEFKLNYLQKIACPFFVLILLIGFLYTLIDKLLHLHNILGKYFVLGVYGGNVAQIVYLIAFLIVMLFFHKIFKIEYNMNPNWIYLFTIAYFLRVISLISDFMYSHKTEAYLELFALYFFPGAFLIAFINKKIK